MAQDLRCCGCGIGLIGPLAWEPPYAKSVAPQKTKNKQTKILFLSLVSSFTSCYGNLVNEEVDFCQHVIMKIFKHAEKLEEFYSKHLYSPPRFFFSSLFSFFFDFLGSYLWHMEVPRLGVQPELQLPACATATAMKDLSCVFELHQSSQQCWILNPLSEARD